jgi:cytochrome c oxidase subunit IV
MPKPPRRIVWAGLALFALLGMTLGLAFVPLGSMNLVLALMIAGAKGLIVAFVFMELARGPALKRVFAGTGFFWLMFLFGLTMIDYVTRNGWPTLSYGAMGR